MKENGEKPDHRKLGRELDLFTFSEFVGGGLPLWTPKGTLLRNLLDDFVWQLRKKRGYEKVEIPHITKQDLYIQSGHWDKFEDELFKITTREGHTFAMKPMNCPHHIQIFSRKIWSYRELPVRYANTTMCYRDEQTGELSGILRTRAFTQDDAHVFCRYNQIENEFLKIWDIVHEFYGAVGFDLEVRLSLHDPKHPEKYLGTPAMWERAEERLREIVRVKGVEAKEEAGEAAFYGPKVDFMAVDSLGREWQVATIQLDMNLPERFNLTCANEKNEAERIAMIHAAIMGSIERYLSILIEHLDGAFPLWLSPVQVKILPLGGAHKEYAQKVYEALKDNEIRAELDDSDETLNRKIRNTKLEKVPYFAVVGDKEVKEKTVNLEGRDATVGQMSIEALLEYLKKKIEAKA
jgi:threonyl-tRNA synthetase